MRIRLQSLLPVLVGAVVAVVFLIVASMVGEAVRSSLTTVAGLTRERAAEAAVRAVAVGGALATALAVVASFVVARMIVGALERMRQHSGSSGGEAATRSPQTSVAEIDDLARGVTRATRELRDQHGRALRERAELAELVESVSEGILQVDAEGRIVRANRASCELLGLPERAVGYIAASTVRSMDLREMLRKAMAGEGTEAVEVALHDRRVLVSVSPQGAGGAVATLLDLTDLRRLEEVRRDFVANASHELKTPLTSIRGYSETLLQGDLPEAERRQFLETISRNAERLQRIVDDLLDLSRLETGRWEPELGPVRAVQVAEQSWGQVADRARTRGVRFVLDRSHDPLVRADRHALEQVFANLYDNAIRYTPQGGRIRVAAQPTHDPPPAIPGSPAGPGASHRTGGAGEWVVVEVEDTGAGIPRDALPRIFERFYRVDPARSRAEGGTGLGLSIVKHMVEAMGGAVRVESVLGKGTTLRLWMVQASEPPDGP